MFKKMSKGRLVFGCFFFLLLLFAACSVSDSHNENPQSDGTTSPIPTPATEPGTDLSLQASLLQYDNEIRLSWNTIVSPERVIYKIYRYRFDTISCDKQWETSSSPFSDMGDNTTGPLCDTPYFYRITWLAKDSTENGLAAPLACGLYSSTIDYYEPNDSVTDIKNNGSTLFSDTQLPVMYYIKNTAGTVASDKDWYKYRIAATAGWMSTVNVTVTLPAGSPFLNSDGDRLWLQFYYKDSYRAKYEINRTEKNCLFDSSDFGSVTAGELVELYFQVYPQVVSVSAGKKSIGTYQVKISNEM